MTKSQMTYFQVQNFDFIHDLNLGHCIEHFHAHAKLIEEQNQILELIRSDTIESHRSWLGDDSIKDCLQFVFEIDQSDLSIKLKAFLSRWGRKFICRLHLIENGCQITWQKLITSFILDSMFWTK